MQSKEKVSAIIQARVNSRRFPGKVLKKIEGKPMIWHVINRMKLVKGVEQIILITTKRKEDEVLLDIAKKNDILSFSGNTNDVLGRYYNSAKKFNANPIIRITGDNPLLDPKLVEKFLKLFKKNNYDYASNTILPTYPDGLSVEIFSFNALEKNYQNAKLKSEREHVTPYFKKNTSKFHTFNFSYRTNLSHLRWTVDEAQDLKLVRKIYSLMRPKKIFYLNDILKLLAKNEKLSKINSEITPYDGYLYSLKHDKTIR